MSADTMVICNRSHKCGYRWCPERKPHTATSFCLQTINRMCATTDVSVSCVPISERLMREYMKTCLEDRGRAAMERAKADEELLEAEREYDRAKKLLKEASE